MRRGTAVVRAQAFRTGTQLVQRGLKTSNQTQERLRDATGGPPGPIGAQGATGATGLTGKVAVGAWKVGLQPRGTSLIMGFHPVIIGDPQHVEVRCLTGDLETLDVVLTEADVARI